ncbi:BadF/BadG/BcrA/BcrD ATPase family protein [Nocardioides sediminis]|uniref:BadF/BadG/BcrA/BcrD ATPase family protein n=1 Tax=Nocardioides sediminis TaxID=433648 RepID=UPI000D30AD0C|nr:BadF/BadG/BcrA/BcrD ATPase family protein [Nocardioides sediminis]
MTPVFMGVDSGGTRTNVRIRVGEEIKSFELAESLGGSLSPSEYAKTLRAILLPAESRLLDSHDASEIAIFISAAGFTQAFREDFLDAINEVAPTVLSGRIASISIANDAPTLLLGHQADAIVIAGTGSNVLVQARDGALFQVGGHEWVASDYGAGFWIGLRGIRRAYRDHESGMNTVLLQRLVQEYGLRAHDERRLIAKFRDLAIADANMKPEIARFAAEVCSAAERGDEAAQDIVKVEAEDLADVLAGSLRRRFSIDELADGLTIVECGGLLSNDFYQQAFRSQVEMRLRTGGRPATIAWRHVTTGLDAALNLAADVHELKRDMATIAAQFRPLVVRLN